MIYRRDYAPPTHRVDGIRLDFTLDLKSTRVVNEFSFQRTGSERDLCLHGDELELTRVSLNGQDLPLHTLDTSESHLRIVEAPPAGVLESRHR